MIVLGAHDGHDAGACILKDGKILAAVNEERLTREKLFTGVPKLSIKEAIKIAGVRPENIDSVAIAGTLGLMASLGWTDVSPRKKAYQFVCKHGGFFASSRSFANLQRLVFKQRRNKDTEKYIRSLGIDAPVEYVDHHLCHAASAYYTSGKNECLVVTSDGSGDGLSASVYKGADGVLEKVKEMPTYNSIAYFYAYVTLLSGFKMFRHEGKITGLAAHGDPASCYPVFENAFTYLPDAHEPKNTLGLMGEDALKKLRQMLSFTTREHWAAGIQKRTEDIMERFIGDYAKITGIPDVAVAGGIFANVRVNQKLLESPDVNSLFVHPHMGDGGIAVGAALYVSARELANKGKGLLPYSLNNVYFGPEFSTREIGAAINEAGLEAQRIGKVESYIADMLAEKKIVGNFQGRMEYGPRALGNRSVLADPTDKSINDWLNKRLSRTEFMPFAPSILDTAAHEYYKNYSRGAYPSRFMTVTFDCTKEAEKAEAVMHIDRTARPQVVSMKQNPMYYRILNEYEKRTGLPIFVNTSFNIHEEPIVCSPEDAIKSFMAGTVDILVMGDWILEA